jgi:hypothetical protein
MGLRDYPLEMPPLKNRYIEINSSKALFFKYNKAKGLKAGYYKIIKLYNFKRYTFSYYI